MFTKTAWSELNDFADYTSRTNMKIINQLVKEAVEAGYKGWLDIQTQMDVIDNKMRMMVTGKVRSGDEPPTHPNCVSYQLK